MVSMSLCERVQVSMCRYVGFKGYRDFLGKCDSRNIFQNLNCVCVNRSRYLQIGTNLWACHM